MPDGERKAYPLRVDPALWTAVNDFLGGPVAEPLDTGTVRAVSLHITGFQP